MSYAWFSMYSEFATDPKVQMLSESAKSLSFASHEIAFNNRTCYPNWREVEKQSGLSPDAFMAAFEELCLAGIVSSGFPSLLVCMAESFPLIPMFGPILNSRPSSELWRVIRSRIFERDNYTCAYCGDRGVKLECDHVVPVSRGGDHTDENLVCSCFSCNRSKRDKLVNEWRKR
jgi:hypothetical protein